MDVLHSNKNNKKIKFNNKNNKIQTKNVWLGSLRMQNVFLVIAALHP